MCYRPRLSENYFLILKVENDSRFYTDYIDLVVSLNKIISTNDSVVENYFTQSYFFDFSHSLDPKQSIG